VCKMSLRITAVLSVMDVIVTNYWKFWRFLEVYVDLISLVLVNGQKLNGNRHIIVYYYWR